MHAFKKKDSVPCSCRTPIGPSQCATGGDQTTECMQMNETKELFRCTVNQEREMNNKSEGTSRR